MRIKIKLGALALAGSLMFAPAIAQAHETTPSLSGVERAYWDQLDQEFRAHTLSETQIDRIVKRLETLKANLAAQEDTETPEISVSDPTDFDTIRPDPEDLHLPRAAERFRGTDGKLHLPAPTAGGEALSAPADPKLAKFYAQKVQWGSCADFGKEPRPNTECGYAIVPLDYKNPAGPTIAISMLKVKADPEAGSYLGSLFTDPGGPGGSGTSYVENFTGSGNPDADRRSQTLRRFDFIGFDPRGTGTSLPQIRCESADARDRQRSGGDDLTREQQDAITLYNTQQCYENSTKAYAGIDGHDFIGSVGTLNVVRDLDVMRSAVGEKKLNYLGFSYGTSIGYRYAELFTQNYRSLVLDGQIDVFEENEALKKKYAPYQKVGSSQLTGFTETFKRFITKCLKGEIENPYPLLEPDSKPMCALGEVSDQEPTEEQIEAGIAKFVRLIQAGFGGTTYHNSSDPKRAVSWRDLKQSLFASMYSTRLWSDFNYGIKELETKQDAATLVGLADGYYDRDPRGYYDYSNSSFRTISCTDAAPFPFTPEEVSNYYRNNPPSNPIVDPGVDPQTGEQRGWMQGWDRCHFYEKHSQLPPATLVDNAPNVLVISSTYDPATPFPNGVVAAAALKGTLLAVANDSHCAYGRTGLGCATAVTDEYFADPDKFNKDLVDGRFGTEPVFLGDEGHKMKDVYSNLLSDYTNMCKVYTFHPLVFPQGKPEKGEQETEGVVPEFRNATSTAATLYAGDTLKVNVTGQEPGQKIKVDFHSDPLPLDEAESDLDGVVKDYVVKVPADAEPGVHQVVFTSPNGDQLSYPVVVLKPQLTITALAEQETSVAAGREDKLALPSTVPATFSDESKAEVGVTWVPLVSGAINTPGSYTTSGNVAGTELKANLNVEVTAPEAVSAEGFEVQTVQGKAPELPATTRLTLSNGEVVEGKIAWHDVDPTVYAVETRPYEVIRRNIYGDVTAAGVAGSARVVAVVTQVDARKIVAVAPLETDTFVVKSGIYAPNLPSKIKVTWEDGDTSEQSISWDEAPRETLSAREGGEIELSGYVDGWQDRIPAKLVVLPATSELLPAKVSTPAGIPPQDLPAYVVEKFSNGDSVRHMVKWPEIAPETYAHQTDSPVRFAGTSESLGERVPVVEITVREPIITKVHSFHFVEFTRGENRVAVPATVKVDYSDGTTGEKKVLFPYYTDRLATLINGSPTKYPAGWFPYRFNYSVEGLYDEFPLLIIIKEPAEQPDEETASDGANDGNADQTGPTDQDDQTGEESADQTGASEGNDQGEQSASSGSNEGADDESSAESSPNSEAAGEGGEKPHAGENEAGASTAGTEEDPTDGATAPLTDGSTSATGSAPDSGSAPTDNVAVPAPHPTIMGSATGNADWRGELEVPAGAAVTVKLTGWAPLAQVAFELHSTPVSLGTGVVQADGTLTQKLQIPASTAPGLHHIVARAGQLELKLKVHVKPVVSAQEAIGKDLPTALGGKQQPVTDPQQLDVRPYTHSTPGSKDSAPKKQSLKPGASAVKKSASLSASGAHGNVALGGALALLVAGAAALFLGKRRVKRD